MYAVEILPNALWGIFAYLSMDVFLVDGLKWLHFKLMVISYIEQHVMNSYVYGLIKYVIMFIVSTVLLKDLGKT